MRSWRALVVGLLAMALAGCMTAYQPRGATGGYEEQKLDDDTWRVSFYGNGNTPRAAVLKYFLYRCAELTLERGFQYFELYAAQRGTQTGAIEPVQVAQYTTYTITTWSASAIVRMYPGDVMMGAPTLFSAKEVTSALAAEVRSGAPANEIPAKFRAVEGKFPVMDPRPRRADAAKPGIARPSGAVQLDDLKDLLPK